MPAHATNKTNLTSVKSAVATLKTNASLGTGDARREIHKAARRLEKELAHFEKTVQGLP